MYAKNGNNTGYEMKSIIEQIEEISRVECFVKCTRKEGCNHVAISEGEKGCKLLKAVVMNLEGKPDKGEEIYDLVGEILSCALSLFEH